MIDSTILVADDEEIVRRLLERVLKAPDRHIMAFSDGDSVLGAARECRPSLIILDLCMPGMSGSAACQALRTDPRTRHIPILAMSGRAATKAETDTLCVGADDVLMKPFDINELRSRVENILLQSAAFAQPQAA